MVADKTVISGQWLEWMTKKRNDNDKQYLAEFLTITCGKRSDVSSNCEMGRSHCMWG